jgi:hypothetical protein
MAITPLLLLSLPDVALGDRVLDDCSVGRLMFLIKSIFVQPEFSCHDGIMPRRSSIAKDHDFATVERCVVEQAIGEKMDGSPLPDEDAGKNPAAVALGRLGGQNGRRARAEALGSHQGPPSLKKRRGRVGARQTRKGLYSSPASSRSGSSSGQSPGRSLSTASLLKSKSIGSSAGPNR